MQAYWSVHDVSPPTFALATGIVARLSSAGVGRVSILVVPEGEWPEACIAQLRAWADEGHLVALHGWSHRAPSPRGLYHRLHSLLLSRDAAEHLGRTREEVVAIVDRGVEWFAQKGLSAPAFYVPPAWAMGALRPVDLRRRGFASVETLTGIRDLERRRVRLLPLVGFEADTRARAVALRGLNAANEGLARLTGRPLRIAIHPHDESLLLHSDLDRWIERRVRGLRPT